MYTITIKPSALKELKWLPKSIVIKVGKAIDSLAEHPRPSGVKKLKDSTENLYRIRVGDYRIIYTIDDEIKIVEVSKIGHRKDIYK